MSALQIGIEYDDGQFVLVASDGRMRPMVAGPRLFRAPPHPDVKFQHETMAEAERDAATIRAYLARLPERRQTKKAVREHID